MNPGLIRQKILFLRSEPGIKSTRPDMPVAVAIQEAFNLYESCRQDREILEKGGLDWSYVEDLPVRARVLGELQTAWNTESKTPDKYRELWKEEFSKAREFRRELLHVYFFVFKFNRDICKTIREMSKGRGIADFMQSMNSLAELGSVHLRDLENKGVDTSLVEKARDIGTRLPHIYSMARSVHKEGRDGTALRNKAFHHLREAVEKVRRTGKYLFWQKEERFRAYVSEYMTVKRQKKRRRK